MFAAKLAPNTPVAVGEGDDGVRREPVSEFAAANFFWQHKNLVLDRAARSVREERKGRVLGGGVGERKNQKCPTLALPAAT